MSGELQRCCSASVDGPAGRTRTGDGSRQRGTQASDGLVDCTWREVLVERHCGRLGIEGVTPDRAADAHELRFTLHPLSRTESVVDVDCDRVRDGLVTPVRNVLASDGRVNRLDELRGGWVFGYLGFDPIHDQLLEAGLHLP